MRGIDSKSVNIDELADVLTKRGITDTELNSIVWTLISKLEPPGCPMTHCKHYGHSTESMNCADGRIPGRCKILRDFKERKKARSK